MKNITIMPSINHDLTAEHMLATPIETAGTLGRSSLWTVNDPSGTPTLSATDLLLPGWNGALHFDCGQRGGEAKIDSGLVGTFSATERGGKLWATHTMPNVDATRSEIHWYEIDPAGSTVVQSGQVTDPVHCYFYPAIEADPFGTARIAADAAGATRPVRLLHAGLSYYYQLLCSSCRNRWGDYGGIADDPATGAIWMFHMYASEPSPWYGTWVGELQLGAASTTTTSTTTTTIRGCGN